MTTEKLEIKVTEADYKKGKKQFRMIGIGIVVIGLLIAAYTFNGILGSLKTIGKVVSVERSYSTSGSSSSRNKNVSYTPTFSFVDSDGKTHQAPTSHSTSSYNYPIGEEVKIYYDPKDLSSIRINNFLALWKLPMIFWAVGGFLVWLTTKMNTSVESSRIEKKSMPAQAVLTETNEIGQSEDKSDWSKKLADKLIMLTEESGPAKSDIELPKGFKVDFQKDYMHIIRQWLDYRIIGVLLSAILFNAIWISQDFWSLIMSDRDWLLRLFSLTFIVIGIGTAYFSLALLLNKTHIYTSKKALEIKQRPLPWIGNMRLDVANIKQLFSKRKIKRSSNRSTSVSYEVHVITTDNKEIKLVSGLAKKEQAWFIENEIEKYLGIEDASVRGEVE